MNKFLLVLSFISFFTVNSYAQLTTVNITSYPCILSVGMTGTITGTSVPGATGYQWVSNSGTANTIWFPNAPGPLITNLPSVNILANGSSPYYEICVRAVNATDTSAWNCIQINGIVDPPVLIASNSPLGLPGDSGYYAVVYPSPCPPAGYSWTITGDATFNNNAQTILGGYGVNINFGPNFTSGILCVAAISNFGLYSDTVCMLITAPVGINELYSNFSFVSEHDKVILEFSSIISDNISINLFDVSGKNISNEPVFVNANQNRLEFSTAHLNPGIYFLELTGNNIHKQFKFAVTQ